MISDIHPLRLAESHDDTYAKLVIMMIARAHL